MGLVLLSGCLLILGLVTIGSVALRYRALVVIYFLLVAWLLGGHVVADLLTNNGIDDSVLYHLMLGLSGAGLGQFGVEIFVSATWVTFTLIIASGFWLGALGSSRNLGGVFWLLIAGALNPALPDLIALSKPSDAEAPPEFLSPFEVRNPNGRNIVYLYLESVERTYFDEQVFPGLLPNLKALETQGVSFTNVQQPIATGWTIAGMVASQCGMPLITSGSPNSMVGMERFLPRSVCLGDLLAAHDYELSYLGGAEARFGGKENFYRSHGFNQVAGLNALKPRLNDQAYVSDWGLYDDSLFEFALAEFDRLSGGEDSFALTVLTLDTHHPEGYLSKSCEGIRYADGANPMLNALHCTDKLVSEFIEGVRSRAPETLIVVSSDHLALPNSATHLLNTLPRRNLLFVLDSTQAGRAEDEAATLFDIGPTILSFLGVTGITLGFGRDLRTTDSSFDLARVNSVIEAHRGYFQSLWSFPGISSDVAIDLSEFRIRLDQQQVALPALFLIDAELEVEDVMFAAFSPNTLLFYVRGLKPDQKFLWVDECQHMAWLGEQFDTNQPWCLAYGTLTAEYIFGRPLIQVDSVDGQQLRVDLSNAKGSYRVMLDRLQKLQKLISTGQVPAH